MSGKIDVSAVVIVKNEEKKLQNCLLSLSFCKQIVVVDDHSSDKSVSVAKEFGALVFIKKLGNNFSEQKNFGIGKTKYPWVLVLDADETITNEAVSSIQSLFDSGRLDQKKAYSISRQDVFLGKKMVAGEAFNRRLVRLVNKNYGTFYGRVHETWKTEGEIGHISDGTILHFSHDTIDSFVSKVGFYSKLHRGKKYSLIPPLAYPMLFPLVKFIHSVVFKRSLSDGVHGFIYSTMMSLHSFLSWANHYLTQKIQK